MKNITTRIATIAATLVVTAPLLLANARADENYRARAFAMMEKDFSGKGQATVDRIQADGLQTICNRTGNKPPAEITKQLEADQAAGIKFPADGKLMGNWKEGEKIAQSGTGFTWNDERGAPPGGNCYNCHQLAPKELSFGTVGPSLYQFGKLRGNTVEMQQYVYKKIFNSKAFNVCSEMPRFGHIGALEPERIKHLVALILDPESPVNK